MCGICGIVLNNNHIRIDRLKLMNRLLYHRGPDDEGYHIEQNAGLGHRRLSIIDRTSEAFKQTKNQSESLRKIILKKAFEGKLTPQESTDKPAGILLKRIKNKNQEFEQMRLN